MLLSYNSIVACSGTAVASSNLHLILLSWLFTAELGLGLAVAAALAVDGNT